MLTKEIHRMEVICGKKKKKKRELMYEIWKDDGRM